MATVSGHSSWREEAGGPCFAGVCRVSQCLNLGASGQVRPERVAGGCHGQNGASIGPERGCNGESSGSPARASSRSCGRLVRDGSPAVRRAAFLFTRLSFVASDVFRPAQTTDANSITERTQVIYSCRRIRLFRRLRRRHKRPRRYDALVTTNYVCVDQERHSSMMRPRWR